MCVRTARSFTVFVSVALVLAAFGCAEEEKTEGVDLAAEVGVDLPPPLETEGPLPAYQTENELADEGKADYLAYTASHDEIFGLTNAPPFGSRTIAEWEPSDGILISWDGGMYEYFASLIDAVEPAATVYLVTPGASTSSSLRSYLASIGVDTSGVRFFEFAHDSFWTRDYGPMTLELPDRGSAYVDTQYYSYRYRDDAIPTLLGHYFDVPVYRPNLSSEGGNFMTNGENLCVMTEWMLQENPYLYRSDVVDIMERYYGCERTVILERMTGEGTGHVDMFAKFTRPDTVLVGTYNAWEYPTNAAILDRNAAVLSNLGLNVVRIPMPDAIDGVYASYTNSLIVNNSAIVPTYDWARYIEGDAIDAYRRALPAGFRIVTVDSSDVIYLGGAVHCTAMAFATRQPSTSSTATAPTAPTTVPTTPAAGRYETSPSAPIEDYRLTSSDIDVTGAGTVGTLEVEVDIAHTYIGDLTIALEHDGKQFILYRGSGPGVDLSVVFSIEAFAGDEVGGTWTLLVADQARLDTGTLRSWAIEFID